MAVMLSASHTGCTLLPINIFRCSFLLRVCGSPRVIVQLVVLGKLEKKKVNDFTGNRTTTEKELSFLWPEYNEAWVSKMFSE
jgi:hypothetical protein